MKFVEEIVLVRKVLDACPRFAKFTLFTPDPPLPPGMRPGFLFEVRYP